MDLLQKQGANDDQFAHHVCVSEIEAASTHSLSVERTPAFTDARPLLPRVASDEPRVLTSEISEVGNSKMGGLKVLLLVMYAGFVVADRKPTIAEKLREDADLSQLNITYIALIVNEIMRKLACLRALHDVLRGVPSPPNPHLAYVVEYGLHHCHSERRPVLSNGG
ncbi:jg15457 [Pararge aegeria aegeria]|uniref:Jg15457 protein n=1 Tax=Pararge aegeria aegeria TaxID=348720 RepID=A0A8S4S6W4_9NEOP|nr:jg15457 [Pararge aegeria aegeria]